MNVETILNNDEYKLMFLKAILLGINYGKNEKSDFYQLNIENEINKINDKFNHPDIIKYTQLIKKFELQLVNLEYHKSIILSNIQKLSYNNYASNHSKITILKMNLNNNNIEIEKIKLNIKKFKELKDNFLQSNNNSNNNLNNKYNIRMNLSKFSVDKENKSRFNFSKNNSNNLVGELEKTLDNLTTLFD